MTGNAAPTTPTAPEGLPPAAPEGLFPHVIAPEVDNSAPGPTAPAATVTPEQFTELQTSFNTFREESQAREARLTDTIQTLMMRPVGVQPAAAPVGPTAPAFDLSDLPDPVQNPKEYNKALQTKISSLITESSQSQQQALISQQTAATALNGLYTRFNSAHPDLAKRQILMQGAAAAEFGALRANGIDPISVAQQNPDGLVANIVARMNAELGVSPTTPTQPGPTAPAAPVAPGAARADSIAGPSQPTAPTAPTAPKAKSFTQQLKESQAADGLI